jgi:D-ribose pyranose/furanose isomerase RbsD
MATLAMWFQETVNSGNGRLWIVFFIGLVAVSMAVLSIVVISVAIKVATTMKELGATAVEFKVKLLPLIDSAMEVSVASHVLLKDAAPKVKAITANLERASEMLVETSGVVRASAQQFDLTIADANMRTQRQVARIDDMVTAVLTTTTEIVETVSNGIRVPAQKIAGIATQLRYGIEGIYAKVKSRVPGPPFSNGS